MLKFIMRTFYHDKIYTTEPELFYKLYKWHCGLFTLLSLRRMLGVAIFGVIGTVWLIFIKPRIYGLSFINVGLILLCLELIEAEKTMKFNTVGMRTPSQIRTLRMEWVIKKFISTNGRALGKKEWKAIKEYDIELYNGQSEKYEDFTKLYKFKLYKQWNYDEYSRKDFRESERAEFRKWCKENNVSVYEKF